MVEIFYNPNLYRGPIKDLDHRGDFIEKSTEVALTGDLSTGRWSWEKGSNFCLKNTELSGFLNRLAISFHPEDKLITITDLQNLILFGAPFAEFFLLFRAVLNQFTLIYCGPQYSKKIYQDFCTYQSLIAELNRADRVIYLSFLKAFSAAAENGKVTICRY